MRESTSATSRGPSFFLQTASFCKWADTSHLNEANVQTAAAFTEFTTHQSVDSKKRTRIRKTEMLSVSEI